MKTVIKYSLLIIFGVLLISSDKRPVHILMAGDSTMADKVLTKTVKDSLTGITTEVPFLERGWGQLLPEFINQKAVVKNYAKNGRSTRTFIEEGLWTDLLTNTRKGDVVIIQFAHNDGALTKTERYTNPAQFRLNFIAFVAEIKAKRATPILCTPVARRKFNETGELVPTHGEYPEIIRTVAREQRVPLVDMEKLTSGWLQKEGVESSKKFFHKFVPGESPLYPLGLDDNTHFNESGARIVAGLFVKETQKLRIKSFSKLIKK
ncbi:MAG: rhamnogalacturonan acetylesterase [Bacteroidia bacterium]|nr:rhamnogalacturonan acetylesterase [Bacteroidia bacterium]